MRNQNNSEIINKQIFLYNNFYTFKKIEYFISMFINIYKI